MIPAWILWTCGIVTYFGVGLGLADYVWKSWGSKDDDVPSATFMGIIWPMYLISVLAQRCFTRILGSIDEPKS